MAKYGSASAWCIVDGYDFTAFNPKSMDLDDVAINEKTHGLGASAEVNTPVGVRSLTFTVAGGFYDTATGSSHTSLIAPGSTPQATPRLMTAGLAGQVANAPFSGVSGLHTASYKVRAATAELTKADATHVGTGVIERGQIVQPVAAKTADWTSASVDYTTFVGQLVIPIASATKDSPCVVTTSIPHGLAAGNKVLISGNTLSGPDINADLAVTVITPTTFSVAVDTSGSSGAGTGGSLVFSNSVNGAAGYQQVEAASGFTNYVGKLRHSTDDSTYADKIDFADNVSAPYAERVTATGTIHRFTLHDGDVTGSGSVTVFSGLCRL